MGRLLLSDRSPAGEVIMNSLACGGENALEGAESLGLICLYNISPSLSAINCDLLQRSGSFLMQECWEP